MATALVAADDAGARPLLRRAGALEEHAEHVHDVHRRARRRHRRLGRWSATRSPSARATAIIGGLDYAFLNDVDVRAARRDDDPPPPLHGLPGHASASSPSRSSPARSSSGCASAPSSLFAVALVDPRLRRPRPLGLRRRLADGEGHARLRRRRAGRDGLGLLGARGGARRRRAQGLRPPGAPAAQRRLRAARRRPALVRLVRLQRRQRVLDRRACGARLHQHAADARPAPWSSGSSST